MRRAILRVLKIEQSKASALSNPRKLVAVLSDVLLTIALFAILYAGYQTYWSSFVSSRQTTTARNEIESQWTKSPSVMPEPHKGFALIYIPRLRNKVWALPIVDGVTPHDLIPGMGHYPETKLPGESGNFAIAGHRSTNGEPLANVNLLKQGDEVIVQTATNWYVYTLVMDQIVKPGATWVLEDNPGGLVNKTGIPEVLTITTCDPRWGSTRRWIWWASLKQALPITQVPNTISAVK